MNSTELGMQGMPVHGQEERPNLNVLKNMAVALGAWGHGVEGTNLSDKMGLSGICLVFPEYAKNGGEMQHVITLAHGIDHINDEGPDHRRLVNGPTNQENYNKLLADFEMDYSADSARTELYESTLGFLNQADTVEKAENRGVYQSGEERRKYRELINAIYVRMMVSFGSQLVDNEAPSDPIGLNAAVGNHNQLADLYDGYINGYDLSNIPEAHRSYALFLWTMVVQQQFDTDVMSRDNRSKGLTTAGSQGTEYRDRAVEAGISPIAIAGAKMAISALRVAKFAAFRLMPRYRNEKTLLKPSPITE